MHFPCRLISMDCISLYHDLNKSWWVSVVYHNNWVCTCTCTCTRGGLADSQQGKKLWRSRTERIFYTSACIVQLHCTYMYMCWAWPIYPLQHHAHVHGCNQGLTSLVQCCVIAGMKCLAVRSEFFLVSSKTVWRWLYMRPMAITLHSQRLSKSNHYMIYVKLCQVQN